jgi:hypothetical protein
MNAHLRKHDKRPSSSAIASIERVTDSAERLRLQTEFVVRRYGVPAPRAEIIASLAFLNTKESAP